jgi:predicted AlkP superfamily pyrophosphatase or phosphodiesterase
MGTKLLLLQMAGLGYNFLRESLGKAEFGGLAARPIGGLFPALTCPVQATMRTAAPPSRHGIVGNGFLIRELGRPLFWEQNGRLVEGPRIWDGLRQRGGTVGQLFIQQSLGPDCDVLYSPAPIHKHHGGMILDCIGRPEALHQRLYRELGTFPLQSYWGPLASIRSTRWIIKAVANVLEHERPDLLYSYAPHLDYVLQRRGPDGPQAQSQCRQLDVSMRGLIEQAKNQGYCSVVFGDYPITKATGIVQPNKVLKDKGWLTLRHIRGMQYPYLFGSSAFCVADHQIAHVYIWDERITQAVRQALETLEGVASILDGPAQAKAGIDHSRSGALVLVAQPGYWFDYRWWDSNRQAPDYATHVDIHNKPAYDPCELFFGWPPPSVTQNPLRVRGTHGRLDEAEPVFYASDLDVPGKPQTLLELSAGVKTLLEQAF